MSYLRKLSNERLSALVSIHDECKPVGPQSPRAYHRLINDAFYNCKDAAEREQGTWDNIISIVVRQDGPVLSAEVYGESDWYQFQIVLNNSNTQKVGAIVG